jgi:excisionase family DNA binding protein
MATKDIMTLREVAEYLQLGPRSVYKLVRLGGLPGRKLLGRWRFLLKDVNAWISTETNGGLEQDSAGNDLRKLDQVAKKREPRPEPT